MIFEIVKRMNSIPGSRRQVPEGGLSFCSSRIYTHQVPGMHTPASTKVQKKFLGVKWELGGEDVGLKLLLTYPVSRICQIFGVSEASRVRQFQNQLGFRPRGLTSRALRQRCGVASTSKAAPLAPHERLPLAAPPPASLSSAAGSAACVDGSSTRGSDSHGTAASVTIKCGRVSGRRRRQHRRQRHYQVRPRQRPASTAAPPPAATPPAATPPAATLKAATLKAATPEAATPEGAHTESEGRGGARAGGAQCLGRQEKTRAGPGGRPPKGRARRAGETMECRRCLPNWVRQRHPRPTAARSCCQRKNLADCYLLARAQQNAEKKD